MAREILMFLALLFSGLKMAWFSPETTAAPQPAARPAAVIQLASYHYHSHQTSSSNKEIAMAMGKKLKVNLRAGGSIQITGWDKQSLSADISTEGSDCEPQFEESSSGIDISDSCDNRDFDDEGKTDLRLSVPRKIQLDLHTSGGEITISNVSGDIEGQTMGGDLDLSKLEGDVNLTTMGGEIQLRDSKVDGKLHTMGGDVLFTDVTGDVKGTSMGGNVEYKNVRRSASDAPVHEVQISTMGGEINVDEAPAGASVKTMGGAIHIRTAAGHVKAETMGGEINLDEVDGWIDARTLGGDVSARMVGDAAKGERNVYIDSKGGDIQLTVPANLSMDFDLQLAYTKNCRKDVRITSDFPLQQEQSPEWDSHHGTPRKYIYGSGKVGDGKNKVTIRTINGDIIIRKG